MNFDKSKWVKFAEETYQNDCDRLDSKPLAVGFEPFGDLMKKVFEMEGEIESVLWAGKYPSGTEDRTWVRAYLEQMGHKAYQGMSEGLDSAHVARIKERFKRAQQ